METKMDKIRICNNHQDEKIVPLISTFAFNGAEFWCPYCGYTGGFLGAGERIEETPELAETLKEYEIKSKDFLRAKSHQVCTSLLWEGERISPDDLPESEKEKDREIIMNWVYEYKD